MAPKRLTYLNGDEARRVLEVFASKDLANWSYTAFLDKVYVRGSDGFMLWVETAPEDLRQVVILEID